MKVARVVLIAIALMTVGYQAHATHLRAGEIIVERVCGSGLTFRITVRVFVNSGTSDVRFGGDPDISYINFGDGTREFIPEVSSTGGKGTYIIRNDLDPDGSIAEATYTTTHTYSSYQEYRVSYQEPNRNGGVLNMDNSINTLFYIETVIRLDLFLDSQGGCNNLPRLLVPPIDRACIGAAWSHNPGAYDPDGVDSIAYEMVIPFSAPNTTVINYRDPNAPGFYSNLDQGNEEQNGRPTFAINQFDGTITWDSPGKAGEYNIAFIIKEFRLINGTWYPMGFIRRDMQIIVEDCENERPLLEVPEDICVEAGTTIYLPIFGTDPDNDNVLIQAYSEIFALAPAQSPALITYPPPDTLKPKFISSVPKATVHFLWETQCNHIQEQPYQVVFKITDNPPPDKGAKLATFATWRIKVVGPKPIWETATLNPGPRTVDLDWQDYTCANAVSMQVWRRVDSFNFTPANCETGMPEYAGYELVKTLPVTTTNYTDRGLTPGAKYCYRLVAIFAKGGESYVSEEICVGPINVDEPVMTNVSVLKTNEVNGEIFVRWTSPFEIDKTQFPGPFEYELYRAEGFAGDAALTKVGGAARLTDTTFVDQGINTTEKVYNYRVVLYSNTAGAPSVYEAVDTSSVASSVRLEARSLLKKIQLDWTAIVPWSNVSPLYPTHNLYRGPEGSTDPGDFQLVASVNVTAGGLTYTDEGLDDNAVYCYYVETVGAYGNPGLDPLKNLSQVICAQPGDETAPCPPQAPVSAVPLSCDQYILDEATCNNNVFSNTIKWARPEDSSCRKDVAYYNVYYASSATGEYIQLATGVRDTFYIDLDLPSYARCYLIRAVDRSGNESEPSAPICFDNCPYYELPNIFTPNGDGCNDYFSAFSDRDVVGEVSGGSTQCTTPTESKARCARFVNRVDIKIFNRWGKEVYKYQSGGEKTIYIDWNGKSESGADVTSGIYYYVAHVTFESNDPAKKNQTIKGWVHLMR